MNWNQEHAALLKHQVSVEPTVSYGAVIVSESKVIAVCASNLPVIDELAPTVIAVPAKTTPLNVFVAPRVSAVSSCQKIFLGNAPPVRAILLPAPVVSAPAI